MVNWRARQAIHDFFSHCDCSSSGFEFITRSTLQKECVGLNDTEIDEIFAELDQDNDGKITFEEFAAGIGRLNEGALSTLGQQEETRRSTAVGVDVDIERVARELFERCDTTGSGCINRVEFNEGLESLHLDLSDGDLDHLFGSLDQDHDGVISLLDFVKEYSKFYNDQTEDLKSISSPLTDRESGTFEYDNAEEMPISVPDVDLLSSAGFERVQDIWDDVRQHHPELLESLNEVMATMTEQLKEQRNENVALMEEMSRQSVQHARDVQALDMEASEQLAEVEELAKSQAEFTEHRIRQELSHRLTDKEDELQTAYDKVRQLEHQVAQKRVSESEMREELKQLQKDRVRLQSLLSKAAQRRTSQAPNENHQMVKKQSLGATKRSASTGLLLDVNPRVPTVSETRQDLMEELEMLRAVNVELKRQVQDKDDEEAMQEKANHAGGHRLVKKLSNLGKYLEITGPVRKDSEVCIHGDVSPSEMSPRSKRLIRQITLSSTSSPSRSTLLHEHQQVSSESAFQFHNIQDFPSNPTTKSATQTNGSDSSENEKKADLGVVSYNPPNEQRPGVYTTSFENERQADLGVIRSHSPPNEAGVSTMPRDAALIHSPVVQKQSHQAGSWPQSPLLKHHSVSALLDHDGDIKTNSRWLSQNGLSPSLQRLIKSRQSEKKKRKLLDEALGYDSSCEMVHCLPDHNVHQDKSTTTTDGEDSYDYHPERPENDGPGLEYVRPPNTLETLQAVADRLLTSGCTRRVSFDITPTQIRQTPDRMYKVVFVGNTCVGKTTLVNRLCMGEFRSFSATIGIDFRVKLVSVDNQLVSLQLWDTAGQEKYRKFGLTSQYYRKADGVILVYDVTNKESFMDIREWISCVERATGEDGSVCVMVLGNKVDLVQPRNRSVLESSGKCVPVHSGESLAKQMEALYFEVSAKTGDNVDEACATFVRTLFDRENKLMDAAKVPLRDSVKQNRPPSVILLGKNPEYQATAKTCRC